MGFVASRTRKPRLAYDRRMRLLICAILVLTSGLARAEASADAKPWLLHIPGISGETGLDRGMIRGLKEGGYAGITEVYDWTCGTPGLPALLARQRNHAQAKKIAEMILSEHEAHPETPIQIVSHSAGAGLLVWALEDLPKDVTVNSVVLLSPALSPDYDLSKALSHVAGKMYVFSSPHDTIVLGAGTRMFGTVDGKKTDAAGDVGFAIPPDADTRQYVKLVPLPYDPAWMKFGNIGDHVGTMLPAFDKAVVCPLLLAALESPAPAVTRPSTQPVR